MHKQMKPQPRRGGMERAQIRIDGAFVYYPVSITESYPLVAFDKLDGYWYEPTGNKEITVEEGARTRVYTSVYVTGITQWHQPMLISISDRRL